LNHFKIAAGAVLAIPAEEIVDLRGVSVPWDQRPQTEVYLAAPDFTTGDTEAIEDVVTALKYHNFTVRRPVKEHGELRSDSPKAERAKIADADRRLLEACAMVVAVLPFDDPGTLVEIGLAIAAEQPVIVYDPYRRVRNPMVTELVYATASDLDGVVAAVFRAAAELLRQ
jgi:nucleoside 2-deoxyribosyltransferase